MFISRKVNKNRNKVDLSVEDEMKSCFEMLLVHEPKLQIQVIFQRHLNKFLTSHNRYFSFVFFFPPQQYPVWNKNK